MMESQMLTIGTGVPIHVNHEVYFWTLMAVNLVFIATAKTLNQNYISSLFDTALVNRHLLQNIQEELRLGSASSILLTFTYFINLAALISYLGMNTYGPFFLLVFITLIGAVLLKWGVMWFLSFICEVRSGIAEHGMNHLIYYQVGGIILTPLIIFTHFLPSELYTSIAIGGLIFAAFLILFREIQSIGRAIKARISLFYIILYLCTLELVPLVLLTHAFITDFTGLN